MKIDIKLSKKVFNPVYRPFLDNTDRYLIFYGGGSSGKSYFIAQRYIYKLIHPKKCNLLVVRQTGDTNRRSTFPLLKQVISNWYICTADVAPVDEIANFEKTIPLGWIDKENWMLREEFLTYARPLILGELTHTYENGLPKHLAKN